VALGHAAVEGLDQGQAAEGQPQIREPALSGQGREEVVHRSREAFLGQVGEEPFRVAAEGLDALVLALREVEHVHVELTTSRNEDRHLLVECSGFGVAFPPDVLQDVQVAAHQIFRTFISCPPPPRAVLGVRLH
jgi:hypothetical protein